MQTHTLIRNAITNWNNWRDIFATERVVDLFAKPKYESHTIHTWERQSYGRGDRPRPMQLSSFASVRLLNGRSVHLDVTLTPQAIAKIYANTLHIDNDTMNAEVIVWSDGRALVTVKHGKILGEVWLAKIDAATIPEFPEEE